jgi:hypothetical protein
MGVAAITQTLPRRSYDEPWRHPEQQAACLGDVQAWNIAIQVKKYKYLGHAHAMATFIFHLLTLK